MGGGDWVEKTQEGKPAWQVEHQVTWPHVRVSPLPLGGHRQPAQSCIPQIFIDLAAL